VRVWTITAPPDDRDRPVDTLGVSCGWCVDPTQPRPLFVINTRRLQPARTAVSNSTQGLYAKRRRNAVRAGQALQRRQCKTDTRPDC